VRGSCQQHGRPEQGKMCVCVRACVFGCVCGVCVCVRACCVYVFYA